MNRTLRRLLYVFAMLALVLAMATPTALGEPMQRPRMPVLHSTSTNWSGYAALTNLASPQSGVVTDAKGTWQVPFVTGTDNAWSSAWVGIDGYDINSSTVEQIGTDQDTRLVRMPGAARGTYAVVTSYYAWWEMYPGASHTIKQFKVNPGNVITAEVSYAGSNKYVLSITNTSTGQTFRTTQSLSGQRSSAEWVMEAPWSGGVLPLADFGTIDFSDCSATVNGVTGPISTWPNDPMTMVTDSGVIKAKPSSLTSGGSAFSVKWEHN